MMALAIMIVAGGGLIIVLAAMFGTLRVSGRAARAESAR